MEKMKNTSPGSRPSPERLYYFSWRSGLGKIHAVSTSRGLCRLILDEADEASFLSRIESEFRIRPVKSEKPLAAFRNELDGYLSGETRAFRRPHEFLRGTAFDRKVWNVLLSIPYGQTRSYAWVAKRIGRPRAFRAVGRSCGRNPIPIVVPCHRVISKSGGLGGYTGGLQFKERLLSLEKVH
jgi:O-6-methylguanine DNA methyltransferase